MRDEKGRFMKGIKPWCTGIKGVLKPNKTSFKKGDTPWNKGLTKETNERVRKNGENTSKSKKGRLTGKNNPFYGKKHTGETKRKMKNLSLTKERIEIAINNLPKDNKGEKHPLFNNWSSREPYGNKFSPGLKEQVRKRDNCICQECGKPQKELKKKLFIHHIDYHKQNNKRFNLIALCNKCHSKTNYNREHWERYFKNIMALREIFNPDNMLIFNENKQLRGVVRI